MNICKDTKPVLFSGIQPSGSLHIGTYLGAVKSWIELETKYDCLFSIVDLHSITVRQDPLQLRETCYDLLALYLSCGLSEKKNIIFCQSHVSYHTQLAWILNCFAYMGELSRMTQYKDKAKKQALNTTVGLFDYPVLMAADILLYGTNLVPVGADQKQHLELARDLAMRFNNIFGNIFTVPQVYIPVSGARIMSLQNPLQKMSKSDSDVNGTINLLDDPDTILMKMKRAVTDSGNEIYAHETKPGVTNLLTIYAQFSGKSIVEIEKEYVGIGYGKFKSDLAAILIDFLQPIQERFYLLRKDKEAMDAILNDGAKRARDLAYPLMQKVSAAVGFISH